jgi:chromosome segregation ATPase
VNKLPIFVVATAAVVLSPVACKSQVERETEDVEEARQEVQEEKQELQEEYQEAREEVGEAQTELEEEQRELQEAALAKIQEAEDRYLELEQEMAKYSLDTTSGVGAEIEQAKTDAKNKIEAARNATTPDEIQSALNEVDTALDVLEDRLKNYQENKV